MHSFIQITLWVSAMRQTFGTRGIWEGLRGRSELGWALSEGEEGEEEAMQRAGGRDIVHTGSCESKGPETKLQRGQCGQSTVTEGTVARKEAREWPGARGTLKAISKGLALFSFFYTVDLLCCVNFCTAEWFSCTYIYIHSFSKYSLPFWFITGYWR